MSRRTDLPIVLKKGKGIVASKPDRTVSIVWLKRDVPSGQPFELSDIDGVNATLLFCDTSSIDQFISVLERLREAMADE